MGFKEDLDKWITREPDDDGFSEWCEDVIGNKISEEFYNLHEEWFDYDEIANKWLNKLFNKGKSTKESALIIEKAYKYYKL